MTQITLLWLWSQISQLDQADSIHGATHHFFNSDAYFCIILIYDIFGGDFYSLSFPLSPGWLFCACCTSFIRLELLIPSNCSAAQAVATAATVKEKPKINQISSILNEYSNLFWKTRQKDCLEKSDFYRVSPYRPLGETLCLCVCSCWRFLHINVWWAA